MTFKGVRHKGEIFHFVQGQSVTSVNSKIVTAMMPIRFAVMLIIVADRRAYRMQNGFIDGRRR